MAIDDNNPSQEPLLLTATALNSPKSTLNDPNNHTNSPKKSPIKSTQKVALKATPIFSNNSGEDYLNIDDLEFDGECTYRYLHMYVFICMCVCVVDVCVFICMCVYTYMYIGVYIGLCMYECMCIYV